MKSLKSSKRNSHVRFPKGFLFHKYWSYPTNIYGKMWFLQKWWLMSPILINLFPLQFGFVELTEGGGMQELARLFRLWTPLTTFWYLLLFCGIFQHVCLKIVKWSTCLLQYHLGVINTPEVQKMYIYRTRTYIVEFLSSDKLLCLCPYLFQIWENLSL